MLKKQQIRAAEKDRINFSFNTTWNINNKRQGDSRSSTSKHNVHCASGLYYYIAQTQIPNKPRVMLNNNAIAYSNLENWTAHCCAGPL